MVGISREVDTICDDGAGMVLLLSAQQLADVKVFCCILCVVLQPWWPSKVMVWIAREVNPIYDCGVGVVLLLFV